MKTGMNLLIASSFLLLVCTELVLAQEIQRGARVVTIPGKDGQSIEFGRYHALVIGNNSYEHLTDLKTAIADANAIANILENRYGFSVNLLIDAKRSDITRAMNQLQATLTEKDNLLLYYAGHGALEGTTGYWQPVDAEPHDDSNWILTTRITSYLSRMNAKHVLTIADSCCWCLIGAQR